MELRNHGDHVCDDYTNEIKEIINGKIYYMSGGSPFHAQIISRIIKKLNMYFVSNDNGCEVYTSDIDVYIDVENKKEFVRPDISIICDKITEKTEEYRGSPTLIVEVASPKTRLKDRNEKLKLFEKYGVKEYWIVDPRLKLIEQYVLEKGMYITNAIVTLFDKDEEPIIKSAIFEGLEIDLNEIFNS
ncbi:MAG: Uma2 family endonuclease [Oscillospiraceae bacterium]|nr:Uma2 family endonuclease [Oscillospiraceae bacterium]